MVEDERDSINLIPTSSINEQQQRHPQAILETTPSTINFGNSNIPIQGIDILDEIYSNRTHRTCLTRSYLTLLSMTFAVIFWIAYWIIYDRCQNIEDRQLNPILCDLVIIFEVLTFTSLGILPFLYLLMIYSWIYYSCYNPMDSIRKNSKGFKIEGEQWKRQLDYYYNRKKTKCWNWFRRKQRKELNERGFGYIILSSHGIVIDELILFSARKNIIDSGNLLNNNKLLKLTFKRTWTRPWKIHMSIYLPEDSINQRDIDELMNLLKIQTNTGTTSLPSVEGFY